MRLAPGSISTSMAGSLPEIEPGAMRELHWHPNADEWQYYLEGSAEMSVFLAEGQVVTEQFEAGDVGYAPMGAGHYIRSERSLELACCESRRCSGDQSRPVPGDRSKTASPAPFCDPQGAVIRTLNRSAMPLSRHVWPEPKGRPWPYGPGTRARSCSRNSITTKLQFCQIHWGSVRGRWFGPLSRASAAAGGRPEGKPAIAAQRLAPPQRDVRSLPTISAG
ncbi:cupin domain-containing protein [Bosea sp. OAE752]|uniref:cupin domain-containing protein n=1 Tax=Bosea sp. OAE752 TaxID=2663873 RepID=UPI003D1EFEE8